MSVVFDYPTTDQNTDFVMLPPLCPEGKGGGGGGWARNVMLVHSEEEG